MSSLNPSTLPPPAPPERHRTAEAVHIIRTDAEALEAVRTLAARFREGAADRDRDRRLPAPEIEALTQSGFFGISVPREFGGADVAAVTLAEIFRLLSAADPSIGQIPQNHFCFMPVFATGTEAQQAFFYDRILKGDRIGNAHSESTKRRPGDYEHDLRRVPGGWRMTGKKFYSTGAVFADWIPFIGYDEEGRQLMFFAAATSPGLEVINDWSGMGQRGTASGTTIFTDVFVPDDRVFAFYKANQGRRPYRLLAALIHAAIDQGIAEEALVDAGRYIRENNRTWIDNPHDEHAKEPFIVRDFGALGVKVRGAGLALAHAASLIDHAWADPVPERVLAAGLATADARILCSEAATHVADQFFLLTGARATLAKHDLDRHWRNARTHSLHDPLRWKEFHLGNYYLNGIPPGPRSFI